MLGPVGFQGDSLSHAKAELDTTTGAWKVAVSIKGSRKAQANKLFNACYSGTAECPTKQAAIVLDNQVQSFPTVQGQNLADSPTFQITGDFSQSEAKDLALVLRYGALPVEFTRSAEQQVSATLGKASLHAGLVAGLVGLALVALYMLIYYRGLGLVVILGLSVWAALMYSVICFLSARSGLALSLAGVTGIIVSVGTTVDSYVVYFERLKDEVKTGKTLRSSTERGFQRAFRTILTADVSSFIGAFLLWWLTVGPVRGFAFFLGLSVILDVLTAYFFTRPLVSMLGRSRFFTEAPFFGVARGLGQEVAPAAGGGA
jgi:preprotein translocase subunit SecD